MDPCLTWSRMSKSHTFHSSIVTSWIPGQTDFVAHQVIHQHFVCWWVLGTGHITLLFFPHFRSLFGRRTAGCRCIIGFERFLTVELVVHKTVHFSQALTGENRWKSSCFDLFMVDKGQHQGDELLWDDVHFAISLLICLQEAWDDLDSKWSSEHLLSAHFQFFIGARNRC